VRCWGSLKAPFYSVGIAWHNLATINQRAEQSALSHEDKQMTSLIAALMFLMMYFQLWEINYNLKEIAKEINLLRKNRTDM
jgi:hypothetical protein